jgi:hypothetical protein
MPCLEHRVTKLERTVAQVDLKSMTDAELREHAGKFPMFSTEMYEAILTLVDRRSSALPIVYSDPERNSPGCEG